MSKYKWYKIGTKCKLRFKFYLLPMINKIHLSKLDSYESFIYNVKYIYAKNKEDAEYVYNKYHRFSIIQDAKTNGISEEHLHDVLDFYPIYAESNQLYKIRTTFRDLFAISVVKDDKIIVLDKDSTITPQELINKCSINDFTKYMRDSLNKNIHRGE